MPDKDLRRARPAPPTLSRLIPRVYVDYEKVRSVGVEPTINHATGEPALAPYCVMAYSAPLIGFPHYHRNHASTPDMKKRYHPRRGGSPHNTRKVSDILQARYALAHGETFVKSVLLADCDPSPIRAGEGFDLDTLNGAEDVAVPAFGIQELDFTLIAFKV